MATNDGGGPAQPSIELSSDDESGTSYAGSDRGDLSSPQHRIICPWRTSRFHDQECERFFDCPTHVIERVVSDGEDDHDDEDEAGERASQDRQQIQQQDEGGGMANDDESQPGTISPMSEHDADSREASLSSSFLSPLPVPANSNEHQEQATGPAENPIILPDASHVESLSRGPLGRNLAVVVPRNNEEDRRGRQPSLSGSNPLPPAPGSARALPLGPVSVPSNESPTPNAPVRLRAQPLPSPTPASPRALDLVLPRWQPDAEVTYCPICRAQFNIFVRKHHCRKCGRVVCNACSPHRITIPYQYIVQPPGTVLLPAQRHPTSPLGSDGGYTDFSVLGGGERVRLCNPCVPDPNTNPPQTQASHSRSQSTVTQPFPNDGSQVSNRWSSYFAGGPANDSQARSRSVTMAGGSSGSRPPSVPYPQNTENRILNGTPPAYYRASPATQRQNPYAGAPARYQSMMNVGDRPGPSVAGPSSSSSSNVNRRLPPLPPQPQPQIAEEDECPVCHRELPPRTLANVEALREAHINICITAHSTYSGGVPSTSLGGDTRGPPLPPMPPRRTGMFPYTATEKDCVDSAECSICLEEFEVGVPMARLECLCRFHRTCIGAWWQRHPGRCPMHQHDSFGY
ncbi:FYVE zinc finger-domain-containing protein [Podospora didyma]|uniref:RING-type E3 ubiquitin transferase n=1 Tax=Podospora didyma TaxID=330526 RepID=A0AAE0U7X6_9PEZI|nr:FYVE zinc finger-domain-containing protein [Podospora didyma]